MSQRANFRKVKKNIQRPQNQRMLQNANQEHLTI